MRREKGSRKKKKTSEVIFFVDSIGFRKFDLGVDDKFGWKESRSQKAEKDKK